MQRIKGYYFKDQHPNHPLISGIALPKSTDGIVRDHEFINCDFHPNCGKVTFVDCTFINCTGTEYIVTMIGCTIK